MRNEKEKGTKQEKDHVKYGKEEREIDKKGKESEELIDAHGENDQKKRKRPGDTLECSYERSLLPLTFEILSTFPLFVDNSRIRKIQKGKMREERNIRRAKFKTFQDQNNRRRVFFLS